MEFRVNFKTVTVASHYKAEKEYDIQKVDSIPKIEIGTELLKELNLKAEEVNNSSIKVFDSYIVINIDQQTAEVSNQFKNNNSIYVDVSVELLKPFFNIVLESNQLIYSPDKQRILEFWKENNFDLLILSDEDKSKLEQREQKRLENEIWTKEQKEKEKSIEEAKEKRKEEKIKWIKEFGSQYLKDCLELGQYAHKEYILERAALEFPNYEVDYSNKMQWEDKYSPSPEAIRELKEIRKLTDNTEMTSDIVWLTDNGNERDYDDYFENCEAVVIRNYLGNYDLVKII